MHITVATDLSDGSIPAARWAFSYADQLSEEALDVDITVVHAAHARYPQILDTDVRLDDPDNLEQVRRAVTDWVYESTGMEEIAFDVAIEPGEPEDVLPEIVEEHQSAWLAVGMTGRGALERLVVGSTSERLAHGPPCNLAICHPDGPDFRDEPTLVVGVDFTDASAEGLRLAASLSQSRNGELHVVHVVEPPTYEAYPIDTFGESEVRDMAGLVTKMEDELDYFLEEHSGTLEGLNWTHRVLTGNPTGELTAFAEEEEADGIVLGTAGRSAVADFLMGSVSRGVVKHMPCSVFLAPPVD